MRTHLSMGGAIAFLLLIGTSSYFGSCGRFLLTSVRARLAVEDAELKIQDQQLHPHSQRNVEDVKLKGRELEADFAKLRLDEEAGMPKPGSREAEARKPKRRSQERMTSQSSEAKAGQTASREAAQMKLVSQLVTGKSGIQEVRKRGRRSRGKARRQEAEEAGAQEATKTVSQEAGKPSEASSEDPSELDALLENEAEDAKVAIDVLSEHEAEDAKVESQNPHWSQFARSERDLIENVSGPWKKVTIWCLSDLLTEDEVSEERQELVNMVHEIKKKGLKLDVETQEFDREKKWSDRIHADASKDFDRPQFGCFVVIDGVNVGGHERGQEHGKYVGGYDEFVKAFVKNYCGPTSEIRNSSLCMVFRAKTQEC